MNFIRTKALPYFLQHGTKGRLYILLSMFGWMLLLLSVLVLLSALDFSKGVQIFAACVFICAGMSAGIIGWNKARRQHKTVPFGWGAEITTLNGKRLLVSRDDRGTWVRDETAQARQHFMGDQVKLHDLRNRAMSLSHYSVAIDGAGVSVMISIVWSIDDLRDYLHQSQAPVTILEDAIHRHLTNHITRTPSQDLTRNTEQIEWAVKRQTAWLTQYGIRVNEVHVINIEILTHIAQPQATPKVILRLPAPK